MLTEQMQLISKNLSFLKKTQIHVWYVVCTYLTELLIGWELGNMKTISNFMQHKGRIMKYGREDFQ